MDIQLDPNLESNLKHVNEIKVASLDRAKAIAAHARSIAPVESGDYQSNIYAEQSGAGARVYAADNKSAWVEFGVPSHNQPPQFVLRRSAEAIGLPFVKRGA
jgi:hypothetical protein